MTTYPIVHVPPDAHREDEALGSKSKFWFYDAHGRATLFKKGRDNEDWSEKVCAEVARAFGLPAAEVELATADGERGTVSPSFVGAGEQMFHGNELLMTVVPGYPSLGRYHVVKHTVEAVLDALANHDARVPADAPRPWDGYDARDQLVGYLLLDVLVANADRHHENWAVLRSGAGVFLAPTYDHASSLGRNESETRMEARLSGADPRATLESYAERCKSAFHSNEPRPHKLTTHEAFARAALRHPRAALFWAERLSEVAEGTLEGIVDAVPPALISPLHRDFAVGIMRANRRSIAAAVEGLTP